MFTSKYTSMIKDACYYNDVEYVMEAISQKIDINTKNERGNTALHYAALYGSIPVLKLLVQQPFIQLNIRNNFQETPLHLAILRCNQPKVIKILIKAGADINMKKNDDQTLWDLLLSRGYGKSQVVMFKIGKALLENGADNYINDDANILIKVLKLCRINQQHNYLNFVCMLLYYGADVNLCNDEHNNAFLIAMEFKYYELCNIMLPYITDFNIIVRYQWDTLFFAAIKNKSPDVFYMIKHGANINYDNGKETCLELSITHSVKLFEYVITHCDDETILKTFDFAHKFIKTIQFNKDDFIHCINLVFEHKLCAELFACNCYLHFLYKFELLDIPIDNQVKMIYSLLMYDNNDFLLYDLICIYDFCGFDDRLEAFLRVNITRRSYPLLFPDLFFLCLSYPNMYQLETETFPTLQALSRNCFRNNIREDLICDKNGFLFKYYNYILQLNVPNMIKDILTLRRLV